MLLCAVAVTLRYVGENANVVPMQMAIDKTDLYLVQTSGGISACRPFKDVKEGYYRSFGYKPESQVDLINDAVS